ncbi:CALCIUM-DEPENDENT PROTEIN KINASE 34-LIKE [Salix viminalis]|uniref:CALCIUM-DEPENDENT PROTEIN KINASE 34-LIKE n=1 Tax=Salix viminalis TaxID=40686 RepID=A0A9Q0YY87_SALVM|nr:CALCIUM-DEPENDENT PROTEIN KINASE 34-LIKE [Salix viminalis]
MMQRLHMDYALAESNPDSLNRGQLEIAGVSFSTPFIAQDQASSFTYESPETGEDQQGQSHTLASSFSSFLVNDNTLCSASGGFSFRNHDESGGIELSSPVSSILSLTFSPRIAVERDFLFDTEGTDSKLDAIHKEVFLG